MIGQFMVGQASSSYTLEAETGESQVLGLI